jgi:hypothetical protein
MKKRILIHLKSSSYIIESKRGVMMKDMKKKALVFILLLGIISFFSDFTHEGARSIYGSYLGLIGASALVISFAAGLGEFIGQ